MTACNFSHTTAWHIWNQQSSQPLGLCYNLSLNIQYCWFSHHRKGCTGLGDSVNTKADATGESKYEHPP